MKAITLHQPWASLIALGVKTVETRSWNTNYRGTLAIHAGLHDPPMMHLPPLPPRRSREGDWHWLVINTITDPRYQGPQPQGKRIPKSAKTPTLFFPKAGPHAEPTGKTLLLPRGAVIATCELVDVVGMGDIAWSDRLGWGRHVERHGTDHIETIFVHREQQYYGDFQSGRFAWLLEDIRRIPARGAQGLWRWEP